MKNPLRLPTVVELGKSKSNSLPMRDFSPEEKGYCWEDYEKEMKEKYPIRYFLSKTIPHYFAVYISMRLSDWKWRIIDLFRRPHMLDTRSFYGYNGGYIDPCEQMLYANFAILKKYLDEDPYNIRDEYSDEEIDEKGLRAQQDHYDEAQDLWKYWTVDKLEMEAEYQKLLQEWYKDKSRKPKWINLKDKIEKTEDEMLIRLMKIRRGLWT